MNGYQHLGLDERRDLYRLMATGRSVRQIAGALRRHPSTIYREFKRNRHLDEHPLFRGYFSQPLCKSWLATPRSWWQNCTEARTCHLFPRRASLLLMRRRFIP